MRFLENSEGIPRPEAPRAEGEKISCGAAGEAVSQGLCIQAKGRRATPTSGAPTQDVPQAMAGEKNMTLGGVHWGREFPGLESKLANINSHGRLGFH